MLSKCKYPWIRRAIYLGMTLHIPSELKIIEQKIPDSKYDAKKN